MSKDAKTIVAQTETQVVVEAKRSARAAGLRYVSETTVGITRIRKGKLFAYVNPRGKPLTDEKALERIRLLAIPPAWENVWICPTASGHIQATGTDARGRKQYRYHARWQATRDQQKYHKLLAFAEALPKIRGRVNRDLARKGLPREKVLAAVVRLMERTAIRVGNEEYAKTNESYGITTLHNKHAKVKGATIRFDFRGKHGIEHAIALRDSRLAKIVKKCQDLPGQELFGYIDDDGQPRDVGSADVNAYIRQIAGRRFSAKDFRTWVGTVAAAWELAKCEPFTSAAMAKRTINQAVAEVAKLLGNTRTVCRKCYIHPAVINAYLDSTLQDTLKRGGRSARRNSLLPTYEAAVVALLKSQSRKRAKRKRKAA
jgi:DNA topoisomerase-1